MPASTVFAQAAEMARLLTGYSGCRIGPGILRAAMCEVAIPPELSPRCRHPGTLRRCTTKGVILWYRYPLWQRTGIRAPAQPSPDHLIHPGHATTAFIFVNNSSAICVGLAVFSILTPSSVA